MQFHLIHRANPIIAAMHGFPRAMDVCVVLRAGGAETLGKGILPQNEEWCEHCVFFGYAEACRQYAETHAGDWIIVDYGQQVIWAAEVTE